MSNGPRRLPRIPPMPGWGVMGARPLRSVQLLRSLSRHRVRLEGANLDAVCRLPNLHPALCPASWLCRFEGAWIAKRRPDAGATPHSATVRHCCRQAHAVAGNHRRIVVVALNTKRFLELFRLTLNATADGRNADNWRTRPLNPYGRFDLRRRLGFVTHGAASRTANQDAMRR